jgi:hypothetical protein
MVAVGVRYLPRLAFALGCLFCGGLILASSSGCVVVRAHQRGVLAKRAMTEDRDTGEARFAGHERGSREGAEGGAGQPGGGCGCN